MVTKELDNTDQKKLQNINKAQQMNDRRCAVYYNVIT